MGLEVKKTGFEGLVEIQPDVYRDSRGFFFESFNDEAFKAAGLDVRFVQDNQSFSKKGVIRGLHFQREPYAQGKLVRVIVGKALDVAVDIRKGSATFGRVFSIILDGEKNNMLYVPPGFAHGFSALEDTVFFYKCTNHYHKESEGGIRWDDPDLNIDWMTRDPEVSEKDSRLMTFEEFKKAL